jgi:hypothetical protein
VAQCCPRFAKHLQNVSSPPRLLHNNRFGRNQSLLLLLVSRGAVSFLGNMSVLAFRMPSYTCAFILTNIAVTAIAVAGHAACQL